MYRRSGIKVSKKTEKTAIQKLKTKFRASAPWKKWKCFIKKFYGNKDFITLKPLLKKWQCHHEDLRPENYTNISDPNRFKPFNMQTHDVIHWLYRYFKDDPEILDRIKAELESMKLHSND